MTKFKRTVFFAVTFEEEAAGAHEGSLDASGLYHPSTFERHVKQAFGEIFLVEKVEVIMISEHGEV